ncbi:MAG: ADP-ribosylglycohydrolase family protein [Bryobacterales bacterium]|nr:ADP-ribosylglycohydrolase family protein [Bryobacterales bacterium]
MTRRARLALLLVSAASAFAADPRWREISLEELRDRIAGGWAGQMIGVSFGAPTEFRWLGQIIPREALPAWTPDRVRNALTQDDLYVDMTFAQVLDQKGLDATTEDFAAMFREARYALWHANLAARRALKRGVPAHLAGTPQYNAHANDIDFQIEADFIGLMAPGLPRASNDLCLRAGRVMNYGDGVYGGMFVSAMYAAAFFERDPRKVVEAGLAVLPRQSPYAQLIADVLAWSRQYPKDWEKVWELIQRKWDRRDPCPAGALRPFNIDAKLNGAYVALGLLYGDGDFGQTLEVSTRAGQDSDCNPASAAGVLGVMLGYRRIPEEWKRGIEAIADEKFQFTDYTFRSIVTSTETRAIALVERAGGRREGNRLLVRVQDPEPARLEVWDDYGSPVERISVTDPRWRWTGAWQISEVSRRGQTVTSKTADAKGAEATVTFEGTGAILTGPYLPDGGKAEIYLDGRLDRVVDVYSDEQATKSGEAVWHSFGLKPGRHTLRIVVLGEPYPGSAGAKITLDDLVVFR